MSLSVSFASTTADPAHHVVIGHTADTGEDVAYVAATHDRACNGLITGDVGTETTTLTEHITAALQNRPGEWTVRRVDADGHDARDQALDALFEAEKVISHRHRHDPRHLVVWDGFDRLTCDRYRTLGTFFARLAAVAESGPEYGVGQLVVTQSLPPATLARDTVLWALLADNAIVLRSRSRCERITIAGSTVRPADLPAGPGHAYSLEPVPGGRAFTHVHLTGAQVDGCDTCWRAVNDQLAGPASVPLHAAGEVFRLHPPTGLPAYLGRDGQWRFLNVPAGEELLSPREVADLREHPAAAS